jgi:hypothetical protein
LKLIGRQITIRASTVPLELSIALCVAFRRIHRFLVEVTYLSSGPEIRLAEVFYLPPDNDPATEFILQQRSTRGPELYGPLLQWGFMTRDSWDEFGVLI